MNTRPISLLYSFTLFITASSLSIPGTNFIEYPNAARTIFQIPAPRVVNNRIAGIRGDGFAPYQHSFPFAEGYARVSVNNLLRTGNATFGGKSSRDSALEHDRKLAENNVPVSTSLCPAFDNLLRR